VTLPKGGIQLGEMIGQSLNLSLCNTDGRLTTLQCRPRKPLDRL
jgi:hypothetical protein